jgi:tRNA-dihydrouridine synthase B
MSLEYGFQYMLAPMEDYTDSCFRSICHGADLTFTEMVTLEALARNNAVTLRRIQLYDKTPTMIQFIGQKETSLTRFLSHFTPTVGFKGFNLNLSCPVANVVNQGLGCAMIKRISKVKRFIDIIHDHSYDISIKMRLGLNKREKERKVYLHLINEVDADFFIVHARHGNQTYQDHSDWSVFPQCLATGKKIIANGDIVSKNDVDTLKQCHGVMIGRAALMNPSIFLELKGLFPEPLDTLVTTYQQLVRERKTSEKYLDNIMDCIYGKRVPKE